MVTFSGMNTSPFNNFNPQDAVSVVAVAAASNGSSNNKADVDGSRSRTDPAWDEHF
jgi:hypothetical protein